MARAPSGWQLCNKTILNPVLNWDRVRWLLQMDALGGTHDALLKWAKEYGPIFKFFLGRHVLIVVSGAGFSILFMGLGLFQWIDRFHALVPLPLIYYWAVSYHLMLQ